MKNHIRHLIIKTLDFTYKNPHNLTPEDLITFTQVSELSGRSLSPGEIVQMDYPYED